MDLSTVIIIIGTLFGLSAIVAAVYLRTYSARSRNRVRGMVSGVMASSASEASLEARKQTRIIDPEEIKRKSKEATRLKLQTTEVFSRDSLTTAGLKLSLEQAKFFQAGIYTELDKRQYKKFAFVSPVVCVFLSLIALVALDSSMVMLIGGSVLGLLIGVTIPKSYLERRIRARQEDILKQLPIVIEQVSIGVSSSLDLWPCISHILEMARQRDKFNPTIELFIHTERLIMSGLSFQDALMEVGQASGMQEIKHCFSFLAQCAQHGGEISKQLQELANSVMTERQSQIEGKISALPVKATGPLFFVFAGFFTLMLSGIFVKILVSIK